MTLTEYAALVEAELPRLLPEGAEGVPAFGEIPALQARSMRYSLLAGGKRLRPSLLLAVVDMLGGDRGEAMPVACALEMIHTYSLIHDDLPAMDNDSLRRGRATNHVVFGEGQAILAGDGLLNQAYEVMLENALAHPEHLSRHVQAMNDVARMAGSAGMIAGQCLDLFCEREAVQNADMLQYIHLCKTACLLIAPLRAGAALCGYAPDSAEIVALTRYGTCLGLLFQAVDDLLDVLSDEKTLGKSIGKDASEGKLTYVTLYGLSGAREKAADLARQAKDALAPFGERADFFLTLTDTLLLRTH